MTNHYEITKAHRRGEIIKLCVNCSDMSLDGRKWESYKPHPMYKNYTGSLCPICFEPIRERIGRKKK